ncbi:hypothetical protein BDB00DRAFT_867709 [Zychaea mexicana]|uniref:uncharacterized protein n=1 Tax=Zychaea mexicana TaxID=64656 RepID=UPI0022FE2F30|nr:uncharacterized protein BDB00DRAFT_867709 [Zychaea mexicana]KAI9498054.1 hypothetical protein BDB00DRAFT_867709 [Zychaea mexicana]
MATEQHRVNVPVLTMTDQHSRSDMHTAFHARNHLKRQMHSSPTAREITATSFFSTWVMVVSKQCVYFIECKKEYLNVSSFRKHALLKHPNSNITVAKTDESPAAKRRRITALAFSKNKGCEATLKMGNEARSTHLATASIRIAFRDTQVKCVMQLHDDECTIGVLLLVV